ncbi:MAG: hypothetical protein WCT49_04015 [Candidatus Paceibacterota bacterium]|jgi:hypothetical protein|nr:hypothetical protein [Candidatus Paceibacterota bacterium]
MKIRIWSKKIVAVLRYFYLNPHVTLFGVTGDIDNLGVYVAKNGRAKAEVLVDSYNRVVGSIYYQYLNKRPHKFFECNFLPAGEEIFILGTADTPNETSSFFEYLTQIHIPTLLFENTTLDIGTTDISFGCATLNTSVDFSDIIGELLKTIESGNTCDANDLYVVLIERIRNVLANQLDLKKFANLSKEEKVVTLLRNLVYSKTLEYKNETKSLVKMVGENFGTPPFTQDNLRKILGERHGLGDRSHIRILAEIAKLKK